MKKCFLQKPGLDAMKAAMPAFVLALALFTIGCASTAAVSMSDPLVTGTAVRGISLGSKFAWLQRNAKSGSTYVIEQGSNTKIGAQKLRYEGLNDITIILRGKSKNRIVSLSAIGSMFEVSEGVTLILDDNITLRGGVARDIYPLVYVGSDGTLIMNSGTSVTVNHANGFGGGVHVRYGTFIMNGGSIFGNTATNRGGGVHIEERGTFTMRGGTIYGNTTTGFGGGGVSVIGGIFSKTGGTITGSDSEDGNAASQSDGGHAVYAASGPYHRLTNIQRRDAAAGPEDNLSFNGSTGEFTGEWDE